MCFVHKNFYAQAYLDILPFGLPVAKQNFGGTYGNQQDNTAHCRYTALRVPLLT